VRQFAALALALALAVGALGCDGVGRCDQQADITGTWTLQLTPVDGDAGVGPDTIPREDTVTAELRQINSSNPFNLGRFVWGTLTSTDKGFFDTLPIPELRNNNGNKTGAELGCTLKINVPQLATDAAMDNSTLIGPLRIALNGKVVARGQMLGDPMSTVLLMEDMTVPRHFAWTGTQR
jgi:hypothetical protein